MRLLLWSFVVVEGKTRKSGEKSERVVSDGVRLYASRARLTIRATSLQPIATPQKQHEKSQQKERSEQR
jgi:hypothetical protein